jgi:SAM-dependent methyltransferase
MIDYNDILNIYETHIKSKQNDSYLNRYEVLPLHLNNKNWRWENKDFPRVISILEFQKFMGENELHFKDVLSLNGPQDPEYEFLSYDNLHNYNYEDDRINYDLHSLNLEKKDFDFFMSNQTLEHVYDPCLCIRNIYEHLKPGGILYVNVPAINMAHDTPHHHYVGFTPTGLSCVVKQAGFEIIDVGFWGNTDYINFMFNQIDWPDYRKATNYKSEINKEVITWIFAKKPLNS